MPPPLFSASESLQSAHDALVAALTPTIPLLLHGSGGSGSGDGVNAHNPTCTTATVVDAGAAHLVADLTAAYVGQLVDAAVEAHDILTDGAGGIRPPPNFRGCKKRTRGGGGDNGNEANAAAKAVAPGSLDDCWDAVEVPLPKVRRTQRDDDDDTNNNDKPSASATAKSALLPSKTLSQDQPDDDQEDSGSSNWAGLAGVDLFGPRRRVPYASAPYTMETKSFIFPVCHDAGAYGRIMEVQRARREIAPLLVDPIVRDLVRTEGREVARSIEAGRRLGEGEALNVVGGGGAGGGGAGSGGGTGAAAQSGAASDGGSATTAASAAAAGAGGGGGGDDGADDAEIEKDSAIMALRNGVADGAVWPGLGDLLPTYTTRTLLEDGAADDSSNGGRKKKTQRVSFA